MMCLQVVGSSSSSSTYQQVVVVVVVCFIIIALSYQCINMILLHSSIFWKKKYLIKNNMTNMVDNSDNNLINDATVNFFFMGISE